MAPAPKTPEEAVEAIRRAQVDREEMAAREEEALSKPASWGEMSRDELEKSIGGRTLVEVKVAGATLEEVADRMRAQAKLDIFTMSQLMPRPPTPAGGPASPQTPNGFKPPTYDFDVSRRPLWEAIRAMSLALAAREPDAQAGSYGYNSNSGNSIFNDIRGARNELFQTFSIPGSNSLQLMPVLVTRGSVQAAAAPRPDGKELSAEEKQQLAGAAAPRVTPTSPRNAGALWQLSSSAYGGGFYGEGGYFSRGRAYASWPCLFLVDYIARKQEDYLAPDTTEAPPKAPAKAPDAPLNAAGTPQVLAGPRAPGGRSPVIAGQAGQQSPRAALGEWTQSVALQMRAYVEPRLRQYRNVRLVVDEARDEAGHDLRRADFARPRPVPLSRYGQPSATLDLPIALDLPRERSDKLHLRGALLFWVPGRTTTIEVPLSAEGAATRQAIFFGQGVDMKVKLSRGEDKSWLLGSDIEVKGERGQLDFRREMGPALNDDESYRAGLMLPGSVRAVSEDGCTWRLKPFSEEQKLTLNAGADMISRKTSFIGAFRNARTPDGFFSGQVAGGGGSAVSSGRFITAVQRSTASGRNPLLDSVAPATVPPDGYAYSENVTWQLEPVGDGACGTGDEPPAITKIFFDAPQEWREVRVPFEFKDLPLPPR